MRENKLEYKISSSGKSTFKCNANGAELLASVNDFANCVAKVMGEKPDKILYRAWMAQMRQTLTVVRVTNQIRKQSLITKLKREDMNINESNINKR